jgi:hypothetical protein
VAGLCFGVCDGADISWRGVEVGNAMNMSNEEVGVWVLIAWVQIVFAWYVLRLASRYNDARLHIGRWLGIVLFLNSPVLLTSLSGRLWLVCREQQAELLELEVLASGRALPVKEGRDVLEVVYTTRGRYGEYSIARTASGQVLGAAERIGLNGSPVRHADAQDGFTASGFARLRESGSAF